MGDQGQGGGDRSGSLPVFERQWREMLAAGDLPVLRGQLFASEPGARPTNWDRIEGMLLGLAIGDALGNTTEGQTAGERERAHG